jgi:hypothetical protein
MALKVFADKTIDVLGAFCSDAFPTEELAVDGVSETDINITEIKNGFVSITDNTSNKFAVYILENGVINPTPFKDGGVTFSVVKDNATTINTYIEDDLIKVQNKSVASVIVSVGLQAFGLNV